MMGGPLTFKAINSDDGWTANCEGHEQSVIMGGPPTVRAVNS